MRLQLFELRAACSVCVPYSTVLPTPELSLPSGRRVGNQMSSEDSTGIVPSPNGLGDPSPTQGGAEDDRTRERVVGSADSCSCCEDLQVVKQMLEAQIAEGQYREKRLCNRIDDLTRLVRSLIESVEEKVAIAPFPSSNLNSGSNAISKSHRVQKPYAADQTASAVPLDSNPAKRMKFQSTGRGPAARSTDETNADDVQIGTGDSAAQPRDRSIQGRSGPRAKSASRADSRSRPLSNVNVNKGHSKRDWEAERRECERYQSAG